MVRILKLTYELTQREYTQLNSQYRDRIEDAINAKIRKALAVFSNKDDNTHDDLHFLEYVSTCTNKGYFVDIIVGVPD